MSSAANNRCQRCISGRWKNEPSDRIRKYISDTDYSARPAATLEKPPSTYVISPVMALDSDEK